MRVFLNMVGGAGPCAGYTCRCMTLIVVLITHMVYIRDSHTQERLRKSIIDQRI